MTSLYRMPGVGPTSATPRIESIEKQGVSTPVSPSVSTSGAYIDRRSGEQAGQNVLNRAAGFNDFMGSLLKIGGQVSDQTQLRVEQFRASDLISNPESLEIIKEGKGPANGLLWSFRPEVKDVVVQTAASEVARDAQEKWITNLASNTKLQNPVWLAGAKDEELAQERLKLEDPDSSQRLRNLTGISPAGTADAVGGYQSMKNRGWLQVQERRMAARLDNNAAITGKEYDNEIGKLTDLLQVQIQADKDGTLGEAVFGTIDRYVDGYAPQLGAELDRRGVSRTAFVQRKLTNLSNDYEAEKAFIRREEQAGRDPDLTKLERLQNGIAVLRAISDHPSWKTGEDGASVFDWAGENGGLGKQIAELQGSMTEFTAGLEERRGKQLVAQAEYELATLPEFTPEAVRTAMQPILDQLLARKDYVSLAAVMKGIQVQGHEVRKLSDDREQEIAARWLTRVKVMQADKQPVTPEMITQIAQLPPQAASTVLTQVLSGQERDERNERDVVTEERGRHKEAINDAFELGKPDPAMITTKAVDTQLRLDRLVKDKQIDPRIAATYQGDEGRKLIGQAIQERSKENLREKLYDFFEKNGSDTKPTPEQMEGMRRVALDLAAEQVLGSIPRVDKTKPAVKPPSAQEERQDEEENYQSVLRKEGGRLTEKAIPKRIVDAVKRKNPNATVDDMLRAWNKETSGLVDEKGKQIYGGSISVERERIRKDIERDAKAGGRKTDFIPLRKADYYSNPYGGTAPGTKPQPGSASPYGGNMPGTGGSNYAPQSRVPATPKNVAEGWNLLGLAPEELGPMSPTLAAVAPKTETVSVTVPADQLPPPVVEKTGKFLVSMAGVDLNAQADGSAFMPREQKFQPTASAEGMAVPEGEKKPALPVENLTPSNVERVGRLATGKEPLTADTPPLPQVKADQPSKVIPLNARSRDNPWVYAVLATDLRVRNRTGGVSATLPDWMFPRDGIAPVPDFATGAYGGKVERPANGVRYDDEAGQGGFDVYMESKRVPALLPGRVKRVDWEPGYGNFIVVESIDPRNGNKVDVLYGHIGDAQGQGFRVKVGDVVNAGSIIGQQGSTGNVKDADSIMSVDFLAPAPASSNSQVPYSDYKGLRKLLGDGLIRGQLPGRPREPGVIRAGGDGWKEAPLMKLIDKYESAAHGGYSAVNSGGSAGGTVAHGSRSDPSIQRKSIRQLISDPNYHAMGRYQFLGSTLQDIFTRLASKLPRGVTLNSKFTPQVQDELFRVYLADTGFNPSRLAGRWIGLGNVDPAELQAAAQDFQRRFAR